jgi:predicted NAD/FAD-dependent oxidoreductase
VPLFDEEATRQARQCDPDAGAIYLDSGKPLVPQWMQLNIKLTESLTLNPI